MIEVKEKIKLIINGKESNISREDAEKLYEELQTLLGKWQYFYPWYIPTVPEQPWRPYEITYTTSQSGG